MQPGTQLGHYEIVSPLGKGGMGEVWRARDSTLGREVAIKTLPEEFARDEERLARFEREAKLLASLNHPNIATIHGLEEDNGTRFLVLELVEGDTLADQLKRGAIPVEESLKLALQIAEALEAAHEKGVIHRDLKPANIKVTPDGKIKVLDFGLAKAFEGGGRSVNPSQMQTATVPEPTLAGTILGTPAYMSPEQARGREVDKRTDIWSFGCVLYEMLTRKRAFDAGSATDIIARVVRDDPDWDALPALQPSIRKLLKRCLLKDPTGRLRDVGDARIEIEDSERAGEVPPAPSPIQSREKYWQALTAVLGVVLVVILVRSNLPVETPAKQVFRSELVLPIKGVLGKNTGSGSTILISPDGSHVVHPGPGIGQGVRLLPLSSLEPQAPLLERFWSPTIFSADGQWLLYSSTLAGEMNRIPINGGASSRVADALYIGGATWGSDDTIVFSPDQTSSLWVVSEGGEAQPLTTLADDEESHRWPDLLPDNRAVLFTVRKKSQRVDDDQIAVYSFDDESTRYLFPGANPHYSPTGHLVYARGNALFAARFDPVTMEVGTPVSVVEDVLRSQYGGAQYSFSDTGTLVYVPADTPEPENRLVWVNREGNAEPVSGAEPRYYGPAPRLSPDGKKIAFSVDSHFGWGQDISIHDLETGLSSQLTFSGNSELAALPLWTPDSAEIMYYKAVGAHGMKAVDGTEPSRKPLASSGIAHPSSYSRDGDLAIAQPGPDGSMDIVIHADGATETFVATAAQEQAPMFSPDGRWIAYQSDRLGQTEIWVRNYPATPEQPIRISEGGGTEPVWARDGTEIYYRNGDTMMAAQVATGPFRVLERIPPFEGRYLTGFITPGYDVAADGSLPDGSRRPGQFRTRDHGPELV